MTKILILLASILLTLNATPLLKTGQTQSYDAAGTVVLDGSIKDDGYYQAGTTRSYTRNGDIVVDNVTGLEWQDNNESLQKQWVTQRNYDDGNYSDTSGDTAVTYCSSLSLEGFDDWRLPSIEELETLVNDAKHTPSVTEGVFQNISSLNYWSSTTEADDAYASYASSAWYVHFGFGHSSTGHKDSNTSVRCVRGGQLENSNFSRDAITQIVTDNNTSLQWQDDAVVANTQRDWNSAISYCENNVSLGGNNDWRLPNKQELLSIADRSRKNSAIDNTFLNKSSSHYWSSTTHAFDTTKALYVHLSDGSSNSYNKYFPFYVRCVRGGQLNTLEIPSIPTNLTATDGIGSTVNTTWSAVTGATYYEIYRSESSDVMGSVIDIAQTNSFEDSTVTTDTLYYYRVKACNSRGCSDYSTANSGYIGIVAQAINPSIIMYLLN